MLENNVNSNYSVNLFAKSDSIPVISSFTNLYIIFQKFVVLPFKDKEEIQQVHIYQYMKQKTYSRCIILLFPIIGNIVIGIYDFYEKKKNKIDVGGPQKNDVLKVQILDDSGGKSEGSDAKNEVLSEDETIGDSVEKLEGSAHEGSVQEKINLPVEIEKSPEELVLMGKEEAIAILQKDGMKLQFLSAELKGDPEVVEVAYQQKPDSLKYASKAAILNIVKKDGMALEYSGKFKTDLEVVLAAYEENHVSLKFAANYVMQKVLNKDGMALQYVKDFVKKTPYFIKFALDQNPQCLQFATKEGIIELFKSNHTTVDLTYLPMELINDPEVVMAAISSTKLKGGDVFKKASEELKGDAKFVLSALKINPWIIQYASDELKANHEIILAAVKLNGLMLEYASDELKGDPEIVIEAVKQNYKSIFYAEKKGVLAAIKMYPGELAFASKKMKTDKEVVLAAIDKSPQAIEHASLELWNDDEVVFAAIKKDGATLMQVYTRLKEEKFHLIAAKDWPACLNFSGELKNSKEFVIKLVGVNYKVLNEVNPEFLKDYDFAIAVLKQNIKAFKYISPTLKKNPKFLDEYEKLKNSQEVAL